MLVAALALAIASCRRDARLELPAPPVDLAAQALAADEIVHAERLLRHLEALRGEAGRAYLVTELQRLGLEPGGPDGSFEQSVVETRTELDATPWVFRRGARELALHIGGDFVAAPGLRWSTTRLVEAPLAFAGNDGVATGGGLDLSGALLLVALTVPEELGETARQALLATSRRVLERAALAGARGVLFFATSPLPLTPGEALETSRDTGVEVAGWLSEVAARSLLAMVAVTNPAHLWSLGARPGFVPLALDAHASIELRHTVREVSSRNVVAMRRGRTVEGEAERVLFFAPLPAEGHPGEGSSTGSPGDPATVPRVDAAAAGAQLLAIAAGFQLLSDPPRRTVLFAFTAPGRDGMRGLRELLEAAPGAPPVVAAVELAGRGPRAGSQRVGAVAHDGSPVAAEVERAARSQGWRVLSAPFPPGTSLASSPLRVLAEAGVPGVSLTAAPGTEPAAALPGGAPSASRRPAGGPPGVDPVSTAPPTLDELVLGARLAFRIGLEIAELVETPAGTSPEQVAASLGRSLAEAPSEPERQTAAARPGQRPQPPAAQSASERPPPVAAEPSPGPAAPPVPATPPPAAEPWAPPPPAAVPDEPPPSPALPPDPPEPEPEPPPEQAPPDQRPPDGEELAGP
jgi:hypothetical protein